MFRALGSVNLLFSIFLFLMYLKTGDVDFCYAAILNLVAGIVCFHPKLKEEYRL